jgi:hypothetical protein
MALTQVSSDVLGTLANLTVTGNVGIGTSVTSSKLHVFDDSYPFGVQGLFQSFNYRAEVFAVNDFGDVSIGVDDGEPDGGFNRTGAPGGVFISTNQYKPIVFFNDNTERMRITPTGNVGIGTNDPRATLHVNGNLLVSGLTTLAETTETLDTKSSVTGTVVHDFSTTAIWYYSSISGNVTANITNVPTTNNRITSVSIVINQGGTGYIVNGLQIDGAAQTIRWQANTVPTASTNRVDVFTFSLLRAADAWTVLGSATSHG